jgi:hypothetical protein
MDTNAFGIFEKLVDRLSRPDDFDTGAINRRYYLTRELAHRLREFPLIFILAFLVIGSVIGAPVDVATKIVVGIVCALVSVLIPEAKSRGKVTSNSLLVAIVAVLSMLGMIYFSWIQMPSHGILLIYQILAPVSVILALIGTLFNWPQDLYALAVLCVWGPTVLPAFAFPMIPLGVGLFLKNKTSSARYLFPLVSAFFTWIVAFSKSQPFAPGWPEMSPGVSLSVVVLVMIMWGGIAHLIAKAGREPEGQMSVGLLACLIAWAYPLITGLIAGIHYSSFYWKDLILSLPGAFLMLSIMAVLTHFPKENI